MQSHPNVCSPVGETRQVVHIGVPGVHKLSRLLYRKCPASTVKSYVDRRLYNAKLKNIDHESNRYKTENKLYTLEELERAVLCAKSLNEDIYLTDLFYSIYDDIYSIGLVRNGYALCEGRVRRGEDSEKVGKDYARYISKIVDDSKKLKNYRIVKFEEVLQRPFEIAESLYRFCRLDPEHVDKLRLKSKKMMSQNGEHSRVYKNAGNKYWFDREDIVSFIDENINETQSRLLGERDRKSFERQARSVLEYFSYC